MATERAFSDEQHEELRRVVGPGWLACDREVMLSLLDDLRERCARALRDRAAITGDSRYDVAADRVARVPLVVPR